VLLYCESVCVATRRFDFQVIAGHGPANCHVVRESKARDTFIRMQSRTCYTTTCLFVVDNLTQVPSVQRKKSIGVIFRTSRSGSHVMYSCHHNSSRFALPHICASVAFHWLPFITVNLTTYISTEDNNKFA